MPEINKKIIELRHRKKARLEQRANGVARTPPIMQ